jgi:hypothetical protein
MAGQASRGVYPSRTDRAMVTSPGRSALRRSMAAS